MFKELIEKTQKAVDALGVDVKVDVTRCEDTGRFYLAGKFTQLMNFRGELFANETTLTEEIYRGDEEGAFRLFTMYFSPSRVAYMNATDEEVMAFNGHPDLFPVK